MTRLRRGVASIGAGVAALVMAFVLGGLPVTAAPVPVLDGPGRETVHFDTADGMKIAATYSPQGAASGTPAVVLIHGEGQTRAAYAALIDSLEEHRMPWLAIDLRGHGESREQDGRDLSGKVKALDPDFYKGFAADIYGAVRWLVDAKKHDAKRIGLLAAGMSCAAATNVCHLHKGEIGAIAMMTPSTEQPGFTMAEDIKDLDGKMDVLVLSSVEDANRIDAGRKEKVKIGPRRVLYWIEYERNAPPDTRREERILKRRGIPPRARFFGETDIYGTKMIAGVEHFESWLSAWFARRFETYPHAVLFDGSVDQKNDYADPGWAGATSIPAGEKLAAGALRWGTRVMIGAELPSDITTIYLRVYGTRGDGHTAGQFVQIAYPSGVVSAQAIFKSFMGRAPATETSALVLQPEEIPQSDGTLTYGKPSFEAEVRLPPLTGDGPYEVRISFAVGRGDGVENAVGVDPDKPLTWTLLPDQLTDPGAIRTPAGDPAPQGPSDAPEGPVAPTTPPPPKKPR